MTLTQFITTHFLEPQWLYTLITSGILLIFYIIRPKPNKQEIPALLFIVKDQDHAKSGSFFERLLVDPLLLIQLALLILLALTIAGPQFFVNEKQTVHKTAIIIDGSASMQTKVGGTSRFDQAKTKSLDYVTNKNIIILAADISLTSADDLSLEESKQVISQLHAQDTRTNLAEAINLAAGHVGKDDQIVIFSDFIETVLQADYVTAIQKAKAQGIKVFTVEIGSTGKNIGIISLGVNDLTSYVQVKNYNNESRIATLTIGQATQTVKIAPLGSEVIEFNTSFGITPIEIKEQDDLGIDNNAVIANHPAKTLSVLVITNEEPGSESLRYLLTALEVNPEIRYDIANPPSIDSFDYDVFILKDFKPQALLPGTIKKIEQRVQDGAALIVHAQSGLFGVELPIPVKFKSEQGESPVIVSNDFGFVQDMNFGMVENYFEVSPTSAAVVVAESDSGSPLIAFSHDGKGKVLYYGLLQSAFHLDIYYPIFWKRAIDFLIGREDISSLNVRTGSLLTLTQETKIKTPSKSFVSNQVYFDEVGVYTIGDTKYSANLISEQESDINRVKESTDKMVFDQVSYKESVPKDMTSTFILFALLLLAVEYLFVKIRGEF